MSAIAGWVAPGFEPVLDRFAANFSRDDMSETGASLAVYQGERLVVDLWGGFRDEACEQPWSRGTLATIWSATKGVVAIAAAILVDRGLLAYEAPVTDYWPEFGENGKAATTVCHLLSHQAGLPGFTEPTTIEDCYDWELITSRLARQAPMWQAGEKNAYHALTYGYLVGEVIRRVTGQTVGQFVAQEIAGPIAADVYIGLPEREDSRVAEMIVPPPLEMTIDVSSLPPETLVAMANPGLDATWPASRAWRAAELPAGNGQGNALGLARIYAILANSGTFGGVRFMSANAVKELGTQQTERMDDLSGGPAGWTQGMHNNMFEVFGPNPAAFGHVGWGGASGSVDIENKLAMGYVPNRMGAGNTGDPRLADLARAVYSCL